MHTLSSTRLSTAAGSVRPGPRMCARRSIAAVRVRAQQQQQQQPPPSGPSQQQAQAQQRGAGATGAKLPLLAAVDRMFERYDFVSTGCGALAVTGYCVARGQDPGTAALITVAATVAALVANELLFDGRP